MAEPTTASPPSPIPSSDAAAGGGALDSSVTMGRATPDDFLASARDTAGGSGDTPPPPERKHSSSDVVSSPKPSGAVSSKRRDRYGLSGISGNAGMKFQFYVPAAPARSPQEAMESSPNDGNNANRHNSWGSSRSGNSSANSDLDRSAPKSTGGGGKTGTGGGGSKKGIDPPEKELPTSAMTAEESARKARARLMQLQHRESRSGGGQNSSQVPYPPPSSGASQQVLGKDPASGDVGVRSSKRRGRTGTGSSYDVNVLESIDDENENDNEEDDDEDYPHVNMEPIESDDEPVSDHFDNERPPKTEPRYHSPNQSRSIDQQSYMKKHPSSAPQRPSQWLPPQQLMQYLHAGRGSFGRQGQGGPGGGGGAMFPLPLNSGGGGGAQAMPHHLHRQPQGQHLQYAHPQGQQHQQSHSQQHTQQHLQQHPQKQMYRQSRRKSDHSLLYSDGINLLETAASEARERDEVDTLNDGINYLRGLETAMDKGDSSQQYVSSTNLAGAGLGGHGGAGVTDGTERHSPRKGQGPPPPPPPPLARPHRPPPRTGKKDGSAADTDGARGGGEAEARSLVAVAGGADDATGVNNSVAQLGGTGQRAHRPPPPRQSLSVPSTPTQVRKRPVITAAAAMDFVMNASARMAQNDAVNDNDGNEPVSDDNPNEQLAGMDKMHSFLNAMIGIDGEDSMAVVEGISNRQQSSFDSDGDESSETESSDSSEHVGDADEFERNTSMSMHAEAKFGPSGAGTKFSRYAEDKHETVETMAARMERAALEESPRRTGSGRSTSDSFNCERSMDPPEVGNGDRLESDEKPARSISPSVLPMRTMNERLYAVEAVIPTPTRYQEELADDVNSFDHALPGLSNDDAGGPTGGAPSHALGPRSKRPGGITGVVLDMGGPPSDKRRDYHRRTSLTDSSSEDASRGSEDSHDSHADDPRDGMSHDDLDKYSWSGEHSLGDGSDGQRRDVGRSTRLMVRLCSHILLSKGLDALDRSLQSIVIQNKNDLVWDDDDPDEPGYVVHRLSNSQLIGVENAFERVSASIERLSENRVHDGKHGDDGSFEDDLGEAERMLDKEERRYQSEARDTGANLSMRDMDSSRGERGMDSKRQESETSRDSVPDFPGIYPPGKGKPGEMECFYLPIITKSQKTGFEPTKDLALKSGTVFANNYLVQSELGSAAFSTAYRCLDLSSEEDEDGYQDEVCLKVIKNTKDYFDQSLDEIKILQLLKDTGRVQENNIVEMRSFFYHREHLVIVTELLRQNLYEFGKSILESRGPLYFTRLRLSHITRQCLIALRFVHGLGLMHCDIKPENILLSSYSRALVKVIDFGSSSFVTDRQSSYIQSRSYRAPEVILGLPYGGKIDMWSLGCVVAEMYTNEVTFQNDSELSMLSRIEAICGLFPKRMIANGRNSHRIFLDSGLIYEKVPSEDSDGGSQGSGGRDDPAGTLFNVYQPKMTTVAARLGFDEDFMNQPKISPDDEKRALFVDFVSKLLTIDPDRRPSAAEALNHPWITSSLDLTEDEIRYGP